MSNLSIRLQQARKAAGLSLRALADLIPLSHAAIKKYEDGLVYPSSDMLLKLARALDWQYRQDHQVRRHLSNQRCSPNLRL
jgi:transcriptional regulator with XRE-family HTH domain